MSTLHPCPHCGAHVHVSAPTCPHCAGAPPTGRAALLLGLSVLAISGCPTPQPPYGISTIDADGDGYDAVDDCDEEDATVHPDAEETPGDGVDSNCDGEDDT